VQQSLAEYLAACAAQSKRTVEARARDCAHCGRHFLTRDANRLYCSHGCYSAARTVHAERPCAHCGTPFRPGMTHLGLSKYCCRECADAGRRKVREDRQCPVCGTIFTPRYPSDKKRVCSYRCASLLSRVGETPDDGRNPLTEAAE
jgi:ribosomal protein S14